MVVCAIRLVQFVTVDMNTVMTISAYLVVNSYSSQTRGSA